MDFPQQLQACVEQANGALRRFIAPQPFQNTPLVEAMHYGALLGGKRLRPFLVYATGAMFGVSRTTLDAPAAAVECIHAYSLMHDDLPAMDDDDLRRGLPTCHIKFGEANAILAGDALQTLAFSILSDAPMADVSDRDRLAMVSELAQASGVAGMCGGPVVGIIVGIATRYPFRNACRRPSGAADQGYLLVLCLEADNKDRQREEALGSIWRADIPARVLRRAAPVRGRQRLHTQVV